MLLPQNQPAIDSVFVYGTLKRGQCRETCWPVAPLQVIPGWVQGTLYGRDDYPALLAGKHHVAGERWMFELPLMPRVLSVLDDIEGTDGNSPDDLYHRHVVDVYGEKGERMGTAYTYFYHRDPLADGFSEVPVIGGIQLWPTDG
ncbi:AIG2-like family protein [Stieleria neptunia]|uniref:AIG2-like family protein n=1 Tax=Stieleria neptunia TaxID=2527979 RepID=A0A518HUW6_9BACT|nr:gamma-glutamylcyclotransferase family protein [Stieleria neptunia]QDV44587.1 AIG2-like family protein [Stieleria neptunia]